MLIAQNIPRIGDNFIQISCLTAVTLDGRVLWQLGRPDPRNGLLTADTPFQIHDIDGDGRNEVVMVKDFKLQVLEGATGKLRTVGPDAAGSSATTARSPTRSPTATRSPSSTSPGSPAASRAPGQGPLLELLDLRQPPEAAVAGARGRPGTFPIRATSTATAATSSRSATRSGTTRGHQLWSHDEELKDHADGLAVGQLQRRPEGRAAGLRLGQRRGVPDVRPARHDPQARADRPRPDRQRRQVPPRPARPATDVHQLLEEPRHRLAVRPRRQPPGASRSRSIPAARCSR